MMWSSHSWLLSGLLDLPGRHSAEVKRPGALHVREESSPEWLLHLHR